MHLTSVPKLVNTKAAPIGQEAGQAQSGLQSGSLFSQLLHIFSSVQAEGQSPEEIAAETQETGKNMSETDYCTENIAALNVQAQFLQNQIPAGKEANSGQENEQVLSIISPVDQSNGNQSTQVNQLVLVNQSAPGNQPVQGNRQDVVSTLKDLGFEGIMNLISNEESPSLSAKELDKYNRLIGQLNELAGKIEQKTDAGKDAGGTVGIKAGLQVGELANPVASGESPVAGGGNLVAENETAVSGDDQALSGKKQEASASCLEETKKAPAVSPKKEEAKTNKEENSVMQTVADKIQSGLGTDKLKVTDALQGPDPGKIWGQVLEVLNKNKLLPREVRELSIRLHPAELGKLQISLRSEDGQVHLVVKASEQATGALLQNNLEQLRTSLTEMGISCGTLEMGSDSGKGQTGSERQDPGQMRGQSFQSRKEETNVIQALNQYLMEKGAGRRINIGA